jgi:hypothetical protein
MGWTNAPQEMDYGYYWQVEDGDLKATIETL